MEKKIQLLKPRTVSEIINDTIGFIKLHIKPLSKVILFLVIPILVVGSFFMSKYFNVAFSSLGKSTDPVMMSRNIAGTVGSMLLGYIGLIAASLLLSLAIIQIFLTYEKSETGEVTTSDIFNGIRSNFLRFLAFHLLLGLIVFSAFFMVALVGGVFAAIVSGATSVALLVFFVLGLGIVFVYFGLAISFSPFIYMRENIGVFDSISRSFYLIKGNWWKTFGALFVVYLIVYFVSIIFMVPFYAITIVNSFHSVSGTDAISNSSLWSSVSLIFMMCGTTIMSSVIYFSIIIQYYSLVEIKDGEGLLQEIQNIGSSEPISS